MSRVVLNAVSAPETGGSLINDSLENLRIPGTNYYDFAELNEQM